MNHSSHHATDLAADVLRHRWDVVPTIGIITGSGFHYRPEHGNTLDEVGYSELPGLHCSSVAGHQSRLQLLDAFGKNVILCSGRLHPYEGHSEAHCMQLVTLMHAIGVTSLVITNAAGGLHWRYSPGDIALITDTIDFTFLPHSLHGAHHRDHSFAAKPALADSVLKRCSSMHLALETGTYCQVTGPSYETRAEIRMLRKLGADLVGMSTAREIRLARSLGISAIGFSMVTNTLTDSQRRSVTHDEVLDVAGMAGAHLGRIIDATIQLDIV